MAFACALCTSFMNRDTFTCAADFNMAMETVRYFLKAISLPVFKADFRCSGQDCVIMESQVCGRKFIGIASLGMKELRPFGHFLSKHSHVYYDV
ncbi:hypothetical protein BaRGS_00025701 [Batillaria attramentaria]|uniref:Uncharacterized protein n=1 Tax=Batillaria attramentaria TaxID=370345 RepID=A0ABD0K7P7_9CAEN